VLRNAAFMISTARPAETHVYRTKCMCRTSSQKFRILPKYLPVVVTSSQLISAVAIVGLEFIVLTVRCVKVYTDSVSGRSLMLAVCLPNGVTQSFICSIIYITQSELMFTAQSHFIMALNDNEGLWTNQDYDCNAST